MTFLVRNGKVPSCDLTPYKTIHPIFYRAPRLLTTPFTLALVFQNGEINDQTRPVDRYERIYVG
jgi:hypothetical protein